MAMLFSSCPCTSIGPCSPWGTSPWLLSKFAVLCQPQHLEHLYRSKSLHAIFIHISWLQMLGIQKPTCLDCIPQKWEDFPEDRLWMRLAPWWNYLPKKLHNLPLSKSNSLSVNRYYFTDLGREHTRTCQYQRGRNCPLSCRDSRWKPARQVRRGFGNPGPDLYNVIRNWCQVHWSPLVRSAFGQRKLTLQAGWPYIQVITRYSWFWLRPPKNWTCIRQDLTFVGLTSGLHCTSSFWNSPETINDTMTVAHKFSSENLIVVSVHLRSSFRCGEKFSCRGRKFRMGHRVVNSEVLFYTLRRRHTTRQLEVYYTPLTS